MSSSTHTNKPYIQGYVIAMILTLIPFGLVWMSSFTLMTTFWIIAICAVIQVVVHLRFFLGLSFHATPGDYMLTMLFAAILIFIMIGGSLWILFDLHHRGHVL
ncbi:cytochrome o ubiquinol oxidase subunit IV [Flexibacterium corallicola]|uniref:cytochrome o ubiquinol oxidase subunit IV n=1 Tax=Flexibacterium corallicola TaxID=3037259 RepID=UPI00286F2341|nr:cytochrome o ubiquinol oxidase subunit IV [Pseudovibrio sp. M1P-2-3]